MTDRQLTRKEQKVVNAFEAARPGLGEIAKAKILNTKTGWADMVEAMDESQIEVNINESMGH